jgi:DNA (cytosine-5)-methyltransferase 1
MVCKWQVEIDPFCQRVLAKHWPDVRRYGDVREVGRHNLEAIDVIVGGFPCQPHSLAGKRKGAADDRNLWSEYRRIVAELNPAFVVGENVPGIKTTILDQVLFDLESAGYEVATFAIPACAINAPHRRNRLFIMAYSNCRRLQRGNNTATYNNRQAKGTSIPSLVSNYWNTLPTPEFYGSGHGIPNRVDRLRALGNAVVPQVAEWIGHRIVATHLLTRT